LEVAVAPSDVGDAMVARWTGTVPDAPLRTPYHEDRQRPDG